MRRLLTALLVALLVVGLFPLDVFAADPVADPASRTTDEDTPVTVTLTASDADPGDAPSDFSITTPPSFGSLGTIQPLGCTGDAPSTCTATVAYTPNPNYNGPDSFAYSAQGADLVAAAPATVDITVTPVNDPPTFTKGADEEVNEDSGAASVPGWIQASSPGPADEVGQALTFTLTPANAGLFSSGPAVSPTGTLTFTPAPNAFGTTSVDIYATDDGTPTAQSATASFAITINNVNDPPSFTKGADVQVTVNDPTYDQAWATSISPGPNESDSVTFVVVPADTALFSVQPAVSAAGRLTFTAGTISGSTTVSVKAVDNGSPAAESPGQTFSITVIDGTTAIGQSVTVNEDSTGNAITLAGSDPESDPLTFDVVTPTAHGALTGTAPNLAYTPAANYFGPDSFTFTVSDGIHLSGEATVAITVTGVNDPVLAKSDVVTVKATTTTVLNPLSNDSGGAGETLAGVTITAVSRPSRGTAAVTSGGTRVTYDPTACATGGDAFTYTISDGASTSTKSIGVTINRPGQGGLSTSPLTDTPTVGFIPNSTIGSTVPMRLSWCGVTASTTSVKAYRVVQSTNGGSTYPTTLFSATSGRSSIRNLSANRNYRWKARTTDKANRVGSYRASLVSRITSYQDSSSQITYTGAWPVSTTTKASGGTQRATTQTGAAATIVVTNVRAFAIVGPKSSTRGSFKVFVDGILVKTVSERASTSVYRRVLYVRGLTSGTGVSHTIRVESAGGGRIDLDAILTLSP